MTKKLSFDLFRDHLTEVWDEVEATRGVALLKRPGHADMAFLPSNELNSLREVVHLLHSPANAARLLTALHRTRSGGTPPRSLETLRRELGLAGDL